MEPSNLAPVTLHRPRNCNLVAGIWYLQGNKRPQNLHKNWQTSGWKRHDLWESTDRSKALSEPVKWPSYK